MNSYFAKFNYSLANEDASIELEESRPSRSILAITGSSARVIPHLNASIERVTACDISADQLTYLKFKRSLVQQLSLEEALEVLGYRKISRAERMSLLGKLKLPDDESRLANWGLSLDEGLIYQGAWEKKLRLVSRRIRQLMLVDFTPLFESESMEEQRDIFAKLWPRKRLAILMKVFASRRAINRAVYSGGMPEGDSLSEFLIANFENYFMTRPARSSFFHQLLFLGEVRYEDGWPIETSHFGALREYGDKLQFHLGDFTDALGRHDFLSLSDVASYLPDSVLRSVERKLGSSTIEKAVVRTFQRHPQMRAPGFSHSEISPDRDVTGLYRIQLLKRGP